MNVMKTGMLLAALTALFMGVGYLVGGSGGAFVAFLVAAGMNLFSYWNADKLVLRMHQAQEVDEREQTHEPARAELLAEHLPVSRLRRPGRRRVAKARPPPPDRPLARAREDLAAFFEAVRQHRSRT